MVNENGGSMPDAIGIPEEQLRKAASMAVCKINIDSDMRLALTGSIRKYFNDHPLSLIPGSICLSPETTSEASSSTRLSMFWAATTRSDLIHH